MENKVFAYIRQYHMIEEGDRIVAGVSGGADSVCLLALLKEYQKQADFALGVVHVNHQIRALQAVEDSLHRVFLSGGANGKGRAYDTGGSGEKGPL